VAARGRALRRRGVRVAARARAERAARRKAVESEIGEAQRLKAEAESMHREYSEKLAQLDSELRAIREEFQRAGKAEAERIVTEATARAERMQKEGQQLVEQELRQLRADLHRQAVDAAVSSAESAVRGAIGPQDQSRLADEYLANLEKAPRDGGMAS
jgi:F-type H+-transporting ATPase subunit b